LVGLREERPRDLLLSQQHRVGLGDSDRVEPPRLEPFGRVVRQLGQRFPGNGRKRDILGIDALCP
jgi:hypothetical protein